MLKEHRPEQKLFRLTFDDWQEYLTQAAAPPVWPETRQRSRRNPCSFTGGADFPDALRIAREGWREGRGKIVSGLTAAESLRVTAIAPANAYDVGGSYPDVPRFVAGDPAHMINPGPIERAVKHIVRVIINLAVSWRVTNDEIVNRGVAILSYIDELEQAGHSVELLVCDAALGINNGQILHAETLVPIKKAGQHWEPDRIAFVLAHPAMLRRLQFAITEQHKELYSGFSPDYGRPVDCKPESRTGAIYFRAILGEDDAERAKWKTLPAALAEAGRIMREGAGALADSDEEPAPAPTYTPAPAPTPTPPPPRAGREIAARRPGKCKTCGAKFEKGARIIYRDGATYCIGH